MPGKRLIATHSHLHVPHLRMIVNYDAQLPTACVAGAAAKKMGSGGLFGASDKPAFILFLINLFWYARALNPVYVFLRDLANSVPLALSTTDLLRSQTRT